MRILIIFGFVLLAGCSSSTDDELIRRALNDEALQELNLLFETGNENLYGDVEKRVAAIIAQKGDVPDLTIYYELVKWFSSTKKLIDRAEIDLTERHAMIPFNPGEVYCTSSVSELLSEVEFDLATVIDSLPVCILTIHDLLKKDTTYRYFSGLEPSAFSQNRLYKSDAFSKEMNQLINEFKVAFPPGNLGYKRIDVFEFFTACRSTLLLAERKALRFHNETVLTDSRSKLTRDLLVIAESDQTSYRPGEVIHMNVFPAYVFDQNYTALQYHVDSGTILSRVISPGFIRDTIPIPTYEKGNHMLRTAFTSKHGKTIDTTTQTFQYLVIEK